MQKMKRRATQYQTDEIENELSHQEKRKSSFARSSSFTKDDRSANGSRRNMKASNNDDDDDGIERRGSMLSRREKRMSLIRCNSSRSVVEESDQPTVLCQSSRIPTEKMRVGVTDDERQVAPASPLVNKPVFLASTRKSKSKGGSLQRLLRMGSSHRKGGSVARDTLANPPSKNQEIDVCTK
tara:strand:+ start:182 stop:727 length:546 start_codon:yes stop_codon:yes gene_type:complete